MKPTDLGHSQLNDPKDENLFVALVKRADGLESSVRRAERRLKDNLAFRADLALALAVSGLVLTLALAVAPYLNLPYAPVPQVISYVSAFAVLLFVYLAYVAFGSAVAAHELRRATRYAFEDGSSALTRALCTLEVARKEESDSPETLARVESALKGAEQADIRLHRLETQPRADTEDLTKVHAGRGSSVLAGIIGGFAGGTAGVAVAKSAAAIAVAGPVGAAIGVALAVLAWRGPAHWKVERASERTQEALALYYRELNRPPNDAPQDLRDNLWERYDKLISSYAAVAEEAVGGGEARHGRSPVRSRTIESKVLMEAHSA